MYSEHFKTEAEMLEWANIRIQAIPYITIISVVKDHAKGEWILFYKL